MASDSSSDEGKKPHLTVFFDGHCNLCNAWVDRILRNERKVEFHFAPLSSEYAERTLPEAFLSPEKDAIVLQEGANFYEGQEAAFRILRHLRMPYRALSLLHYLPRRLREWGYANIARNRYRWFGKREECRMPSPEERQRFLS